MQFHSIWTKAIQHILKEICSDLSNKEYIYNSLAESIGLIGDEVNANGILAGGTSKDITIAFTKILKENGYEMKTKGDLNQWISNEMLVYMKSCLTDIKPTSVGLNSFLEELKKKDIAIGIATADDYLTTEVCLDYLGIKEHFNFIITSDRFPYQKPDPSVLEAFCKHTNLKPKEVAVVGDTIVDLTLAKNAGAGLAIGVLSGASSRHQLETLADIIIPSVVDILDDNKLFIWDQKDCDKEIS